MERPVDKRSKESAHTWKLFHYWDGPRCKASIVLGTQGLGSSGRSARRGKVGSSSGRKASSRFLLIRRHQQRYLKKTLVKGPDRETRNAATWARNANMLKNMADQGVVSPRLQLLLGTWTLDTHQVWWGKGSFHLWELISRAFVIACGWGWKIAHKFSVGIRVCVHACAFVIYVNINFSL